MGIFDRLFGNRPEPKSENGFFKLLNGYTPVFQNWNSGLYESELCRTSIDAIARNISKLEVTISGTARKDFRTKIKQAPNDFQTWSQFLYRLATILYVNNTAFIVPTIGEMGQTIGFYPICPNRWELVQVNNVPWIRFHFDDGQRMAIELNRVGIMTRYQYRSDLFGENNEALRDTMNLIHIQRQGIEESTKNAASYRFMAKVGNFTKTEDLVKERKRFNTENFKQGGGGILLFPNTYADIKQVNQQSYSVDSDQMSLIQNNVFNYFGVNQDVIQNKAYGDAWSAFYEGVIEVFAVQLSEVMTRMVFTERERSLNAAFFFTANRLQYMSNSDKLNVSKDLLDRGILSLNEVRTIWNLPEIEDGDAHIIRGEYYQLTDKIDENEDNSNEEQ